MNADDLHTYLARPEVADYLDRMVGEAPPLTTEQRVALYELLRPIRQRRAAERQRYARGEGDAA